MILAPFYLGADSEIHVGPQCSQNSPHLHKISAISQQFKAELLEGKKILYPEHRVETFAKAERKSKARQEGLLQP